MTENLKLFAKKYRLTLISLIPREWRKNFELSEVQDKQIVKLGYTGVYIIYRGIHFLLLNIDCGYLLELNQAVHPHSMF